MHKYLLVNISCFLYKLCCCNSICCNNGVEIFSRFRSNGESDYTDLSLIIGEL